MRSLLCRSAFMSSMQLPPFHPNRPHPALLHAIVGAAAPLSPFFDARSNGDNDEVRGKGMLLFSHPNVKPSAEAMGLTLGMDFMELHLHLARAKIEEAVMTQHSNPMDWMQAAALVAYGLFDRVRTMECFFLVAVMGRAVGPTGVNKMGTRHGKQISLFPPPANAAEEHERRMIMWHFYLGECDAAVQKVLSAKVSAFPQPMSTVALLSNSGTRSLPTKKIKSKLRSQQLSRLIR
jgi:hypothetical protein